MRSPITGFESDPAFEVLGYTYYRCNSGTLFGSPITQSRMVGGTGDRNDQNPVRAARLSAGRILDYGCGNGGFVEYLRSTGVDATGYDPYSDQFAEPPPLGDTFQCITMIEVIEHMHAPFSEIDLARDMLVPGGTLYIETSFSDWVGEGHDYANPSIGHAVIFSHAGLDYLMLSKGFKVGSHINANARVYYK